MGRNLHRVVALADLARRVRGYENVKSANTERFRADTAGLLAELAA